MGCASSTPYTFSLSDRPPFMIFVIMLHHCGSDDIHLQQHSPTLSCDLVPATLLIRSATTLDHALLREHFFADLHEGLNDELVVARGVQLEEALEKLSEIGFCVDLSLEDHLEHGGSEILMWVV
ncbi:uncharacterized protein LOC114379014 [Glycine soja]|uniref:uncharacterized protein n=1 Tax=Glycine max TaxID=3847 RepID=UPI0007191B3B|nr:uncharacterized protein LOC106795343 [Glycine max]XP_028193378.1 uncharacterized protein LOC114379014 [Glycine soja]|eukprot:XP_014620256.1 uncharacterized protein LOC106795343 [Glycine max]